MVSVGWVELARGSGQETVVLKISSGGISFGNVGFAENGCLVKTRHQELIYCFHSPMLREECIIVKSQWEKSDLIINHNFMGSEQTVLEVCV